MPEAATAGVMFFGELGLDGRVRPVRGVLPAVVAAAQHGFGRVMVASQNAAEALLVPGVRVIAAATLTEAADWLRGLPGPTAAGRPPPNTTAPTTYRTVMYRTGLAPSPPHPATPSRAAR